MALFRMGLVVLMVSLAVATATASAYPMDTEVDAEEDLLLANTAEVMEEEMMMESESAHRLLRGRENHVSQGAMQRNRVPCNTRGKSYYDNSCRNHQQANPYKRDCNTVSHCVRINR